MGLSGGLQKLLPSATTFREVDLRSFQNGIHRSSTTKELRPLRIGIDICVWMVAADIAFAGQLGDERHFSNRGRAELVHAVETAEREREQLEKDLHYVNSCTEYVMKRLKALQNETKVEILVVFDGATPPVKATEVNDRRDRRAELEQQRDEPVDVTGSQEAEKRRLKAYRRAGASRHYAGVYTAVMEALRHAKIAFLVAPYESDGQLAFLSMNHYIDLIITEDSDLLCYDAGPVLLKLRESKMSEGSFKGTLVYKEDLAANNQDNVNLLDFSSAMLSVLFVATGSDYSPKLEGIGIVTACKIVRSAFFSGRNDRLAVVFQELFAVARRKHDLSDEDKETYQTKFLEALVAFRHPVIFDPVERCCRIHGLEDVRATEAELLTHAPYAELVQDARRRERITGTIYPPSLSILIAEGYVCPRTLKARTKMTIPKSVKVELIQLGIWKDFSSTTEADKSKRKVPSSSHAWFEEDTSASADDRASHSNERSSVKRKSVNSNNNPQSVLYIENSDESDDLINSQPLATQQPR